MRSIRTPELSALLLISALAAPASAQWPMQARSPSRDAASPGAAELAEPAIAWRHYLGGAVSDQALVSRDVDGDGRAEVIYVSGGRLVCKRDDDRVVWESAPFALNRIVAIEDLDGDGEDELLALGRPPILAIFRLTDGGLLWRTERSTFGFSVNAVRLGQLVPGGPREVYAADSLSATNSLGDDVYAFSFASGFGSGRPDATTQLWQVDASHRGDPVTDGDVVADVDGDGTDEVIAFDGLTSRTQAYMHIYEGADGSRRGPDIGYPMGVTMARALARQSRVADLDGDGTDEIIVSTNTSGYSGATCGCEPNTKAIFVVGWDASRPAGEELHVLWHRDVASIADDLHFFNPQHIGDLDGDGDLEVLTSFDEGGARTTHIFDGMTGVEQDTVAGAQLRGLVDLEDGAPPTVLLRIGATLRGFTWTGGALAEAFELGAADAAFTYARPITLAGKIRGGHPVVLPLTSDATRRGIVTDTASELSLWDPQAPSAPIATFAVEAPLEIATLAPQSDVGGGGPGLFVQRSDGFLEVVDAALDPPDPGEFADRGLRVGGYYSGRFGLGDSPVGGPLGGEAHSVVVRDGRGDLVRLDAASATLTLPPEEAWRWGGARRPVLVDEDGNGAFEEVVAQVGRGIAGRSTADGATATFDAPNLYLSGGSISGDHVPLRTPTGTRFAVPIRTLGGVAMLIGVDRTGTAWTSMGYNAGSSIAGYLAADDLDADGFDDALLAMMRFKVVYGADGTDVELPGHGANYPSMPIVIDAARNAGAATHLATGGLAPSAITVTGTSVDRLWSYPTEFASLRHFATLVECGATVLVGARGESAALAMTDVTTHVDGAEPTEVWLADGALYPSEAALDAADVYPGALGNVTSIADLDGSGRPAAFVGSTDGYLYAVDVCASPPALIWALNLRAPVGESVLLDTDGDGAEEIVVSVADGFLYGIDTERFPRPEPVLDVEPGGDTAVDVDVTRAQRLAASWAAVPDAEGYEWAVFTSGGTSVSRNPDDPTNPFTPVSRNVTYVEFGEGLSSGASYYFAVRAVGPEGASSEALSDGTLFELTVPPAPDAGPRPDAGMGSDAGPVVQTDAGPLSPPAEGCSCRASGPRRGGAGWLLGLGLLVALRRRRAR